MSTIESSAPTSWKCTFSIVVLCTFASALPTSVKIFRACPFTASLRSLPSMIARMSFRWRCFISDALITTSSLDGGDAAADDMRGLELNPA